MKPDKKDIYRAKIGSLRIRGGITPTGRASIILGMPSAERRDVFVSLKIDGKDKMLAIVDCVSVIITEVEIREANKKEGRENDEAIKG